MTKSRNPPSRPRIPASRLSADRLMRLDDFIQTRYIDPKKLPGTMTLVAHGGEIRYRGILGQMDMERGKPMREDAIFRIHSMTKPITSLAFMMLVEEGRAALDEPVHRYIPEWRSVGVFKSGTAGNFQTVPPQRPMLIIDLLRHTSGLTYGFQECTNVDAAYRAAGYGILDQTCSLEDMIAGLADIPLDYSPGDVWNYSISTDVLGYILSEISEAPLDTVLKTRIFEPLGMTDTGFSVRRQDRDRLAACYVIGADGNLELMDDPATSGLLDPPSFLSGGGGLVSTAKDYLQFCAMLRHGGTVGGRKIIGRKTLEFMTENHLPGGKYLPQLAVSMGSEPAFDGIGFGLGFAITVDPVRTLVAGSPGDYFWGGVGGTYFWIDPVEDLIVIFMTQVIPSTAYRVREELRAMVYAALD